MEPLSASPAPAGAMPALRRRLWRTGSTVVGGSVLATLLFVHIAMTQFGGIVYFDAMVAALIIPLVVASLAFAYISALTLKLEASRRELERLALEDPLTGIANRRAALARLNEWSQQPGPVALAIADIDYFKRVNDRLGHDGGDASLVHFAGMLRRMVPDTWLVARFGGEEFLIAAHNVDFAAFAARIEAVRVAVAETPLITSAGPYRLTSSFGIAETGAEPGSEAAVTRLITRADTALYAAKQAGRNRTERAA